MIWRGANPAEKPTTTARTLNLDESSKLKLKRRVVMKKLYGVVTLATLMGATLLLEKTLKAAPAAPHTGIKNVVLVHGAFADGSGWEAVANILKKDGHTVSVVQHPEKSAEARMDAVVSPGTTAADPELWSGSVHPRVLAVCAST
jgi:hypothetical protein